MKKGQNIEEFGQLLGRSIRSQLTVQTHWCTVKSVNWADKTLTAVGVEDDLPFYDVLLGLGSFYRKPTPGSLCLVGIIADAPADAFLLDAESFDQAVWYSGKSEFTLKKEGFILQRDDASLKQVLNDWQDAFAKLCDAVSKIVVSVGVSPDVVVINQIKQQVKQDIQKRTNQILTA